MFVPFYCVLSTYDQMRLAQHACPWACPIPHQLLDHPHTAARTGVSPGLQDGVRRIQPPSSSSLLQTSGSSFQRMRRLALRRARGRKETSNLFLEVMAGDVGGLVLGHLNGRDRVALLYCLNKNLVRAVLQDTLFVEELSGNGTLSIAESLQALLAFRRIGGLDDTTTPLANSVFLAVPSKVPAQAQLQPLVAAATAAGVRKLTLGNIAFQARCTRTYSPLTLERALEDIQSFSCLRTLELCVVHMRGGPADQEHLVQLAALSALPCLQQLTFCCSLYWGAVAIHVPGLRQLRSLAVGVCGPVAVSVSLQGPLTQLTKLLLNTRRIAQVSASSPDALPALQELALGRSPPTCQPGLLRRVQLLELHSSHPVRSRRLAQLAATLPALDWLMLPAAVWRCLHLPLSSLRILVLDLATTQDVNLLRDRLPLFPNLVCLYLNRPTSEVRGAFQEQVLQTLKSHQPEAQVDIMDVEVPEPFDDAYLGDWEL